jgi:hypothetical protein
MAIQYSNIPEKLLSRGIDSRSAENSISEGFVKDLLNADVIENRIKKRKGFQSSSGEVPVRVTSLQYLAATNEVCFTMDSSVSLDTTVSLEAIRSSPLVVYGRSSKLATGPFTSAGDTVRYYSKFTIPTRKQFVAPSGTLLVSGTEHGLGNTDIFVDVVESTSLTNRSYSKILTNSMSINETSFDISAAYTTSTDRNVFMYFANKIATAGNSYCATLTKASTGSETFSIPASTHNLVNYNITMQLQQDTGTSRVQVVPESFLITNTGDTSVTINGASGTIYRIILSAAPVSNTISGAVDALSSGTVTITAPEKPWVFLGIYLEQTPGGTKELVYPDSVDYNSSTNNIDLSFTNNGTTAKNFIVAYEYGDLRSNILCVTDALATVNGEDSLPQLTVWGLSHSEIYTTKSAREGWVNHIDSYRRAGEQRLICGLGGNLFSSQTYNEAATEYLLPNLYPSLYGRTSASKVVGPVFYATGSTPARTRGYVTGDGLSAGQAAVISVLYDAGNGWTKYTISVPNKAVVDSTGISTSLAGVISTTENLEDWLTVTQMSYSRHEGTFKIRQILDGTDEIQIWVENTTNSSDYDDAGTSGQGGIFTDQISLLVQSNFVPLDILASSSLGSTFVSTVVSASGTILVSDSFTSLVQVPAGILITAQRTSALVPLRQSLPSLTPSVTNLVQGDVLTYTGIERNLTVKFINSDSNRGVNIAGNGTTAVATLTSGNTNYLTINMQVCLIGAGAYSGPHTVVEVLSSTTFSFASTKTDTVTGAIMLGNTAQLDEELTWADTAGDQTSFFVNSRWIPVEGPDDSYNLTPPTHVRYFDTDSYSSQSFIRSTTVTDNMYLTNSKDQVFKFDGSSLYRAGLPAWQPGLFLTQNTASTAKIVAGARSLTYTVPTGSSVSIPTSLTESLPVGTQVRLSGSTSVYTIGSYHVTSGATDTVSFDRALDSGVIGAGSGTMTEVVTYRYYFRLNAVDANNNVVISAVTGHEDFVIEMAVDASINLKLVGLPALDNYDYDRLEIQIYRTKKGLSAPFYLITTLPVSFNNTTGYITYVDSFADQDLTQLDAAATAITGAELPVGASDPLRAKYVTAIGNKLVLGYVSDTPQLDVQIVGNANLSAAQVAGGSLVIRRDSSLTGTVTDMTDIVKLEWVNGFTNTVTSITPGTNLFTIVTVGATGAVAGDWIYLTYNTVATSGRDLTYSGWWQIASVAGLNVVVNLTGAAAASSYPNRYVIATDPTNIPVLLGTDGNMGQANGSSFTTFDTMRRASMAINAAMRQVDVTLNPTFSPWMIARSGNDLTNAGRLVIKFPHVQSATPSLVPTFSTYLLYVNSVNAPSTVSVLASTRVYPSRILFSAADNYAEVFDSPDVILDSDSASVLDINSSDGQAITGIIPFFGQAAFTPAQQSSILIVFKTNSIYLVDLNQKALGNQALQRIETQGLGCTAPYSISVTRDGIVFANESGIYCLRRDQSIQYLGKFMERNWTEQVSLAALEIAQGHHYGTGRSYKLSVPISGTETSTQYIENSQVYVYNHTQETETTEGAWGRYDAHPATGWANLGADAHFGTTSGNVMGIRTTGLVSDYRDDDQPITFRMDTRPNDYGNSGIRKVVDSVTVHYRTGAENVGTTLSYSVDLLSDYTPTEPFILPQPTNTTGLSVGPSKSIVTIRHDVGRRRGVYFSMRVENATIDEAIEVAGLDYRVGGLDNKGILSAGATTKGGGKS